MFCNEPIKRVYQRQDWENEEGRWQDALLEEAFTFEYHATDGYWLIFETENNVISVGFDGVKQHLIQRSCRIYLILRIGNIRNTRYLLGNVFATYNDLRNTGTFSSTTFQCGCIPTIIPNRLGLA